MSFYNTCPFCSVHLDPDERCDCIDTGLPECITISRNTNKAAAGVGTQATAKKMNTPRILLNDIKNDGIFQVQEARTLR